MWLVELLGMADDGVVDRKLSDEEAEALLHRVMWPQGRLSLKIAAVFIAILIVLPLFNLYAPSLAATSIAGFPLTWLCLGVLFYPLTWALSNYFVKHSDRIEEEIAREDRS